MHPEEQGIVHSIVPKIPFPRENFNNREYFYELTTCNTRITFHYTVRKDSSHFVEEETSD